MSFPSFFRLTSSALISAGETQHSMTVRELPPREDVRSLVSLESR